ncbi:MAG: alpha/beta hydrolase [Cyclobacteriaceae bacterium]
MDLSKDSCQFVCFILLLLVLAGESIAQIEVIPRDTTYTLRSTLAKVQKYHKIEVSAVYSNPSEIIQEELEKVCKTIGNRKLTFNLFYPNERPKGGFPILVMVHGGGWKSGDKSLMTPMAEKFAEAGYVVIAPEYRLSPEAQYPTAVLDIFDMTEWAEKNGKKYGGSSYEMVILGCSVGGQLAALIGNTYHKDIFRTNKGNKRASFKAIVDVDGVLAFHHPNSKEGEVAAEWLGGFYEDVPEIWEGASALSHVDASTPPTLFIGSMYPRFLAGRKEYSEVLNEHQVYSETQVFENAPHSFWLLNPWFEPTVQCTLNFLKKALKK